MAAALRTAGVPVEVHDVWFKGEEEKVEDPRWLELCGKHGWIALTKDDRLRYHELEKQVLISSRVAVFTLTARNISGEHMAARFVKARARMERLFLKVAPPFIAYITPSSAIGRVLTEADLVQPQLPESAPLRPRRPPR